MAPEGSRWGLVGPTWYSRHQASAQEMVLEAAEGPDVHWQAGCHTARSSGGAMRRDQATRELLWDQNDAVSRQEIQASAQLPLDEGTWVFGCWVDQQRLHGDHSVAMWQVEKQPPDKYRGMNPRHCHMSEAWC